MATAYRPITADRRAGERRLAVQVTDATLEGGEGGPVAAELTEVSIYGCRLLVPAGRDFTGSILVRLDGGAPIPTQVAWNRAGVLACRFDAPITRAQLRSLTIRAV